MSGQNVRPDWVTRALLLAILFVLVGLLVVMFTSKKGAETHGDRAEQGRGVASGETASRKELPNPPKPPQKPVADPDRIKQALQAGKTYQSLLKVGLTSRVEDKDWGTRAIITIVYAGEMELKRKIESNDGQRIVEVRTFEVARNTKLLTETESVSIELGVPGMLMLGAIEINWPGTTAAVMAIKPLAESVIGVGVNAVIADQAAKAKAHVESLQGKTVRIVYVDGVGVDSVTPINCDLDDSERDFVFTTAVLSDCYILPEIKNKPGSKWKVDGTQFAGFIDPSWRGIPEGDIWIVREANESKGGKDYALLRIEDGFVRLNASDDRRRRMGTFTPLGQMRFCLTDRQVETAELECRVTKEEISKDHILFESRFKETPTMKVSYFSQILP